MYTFNHCNLNITDPEQSLAFYREALGLEVVREKESADHSFKLFFWEIAGQIFGWNSPGYGSSATLQPGRK